MIDEIQSTDRQLAVTFAIKLPEHGMLSENDERLVAASPAHFGLEDLDGQFRFELGETLEIEDDLVYLAWRLCLDAVPHLRNRERYEMRFYTRSDGVVFEPMGDQTQVLVAGEPSGTYPSQELAAEMIACVRRLARTLERLGTGNVSVTAAAAALVDRIVELDVG